MAQSYNNGQYTGWGSTTSQEECENCQEQTSTTWYQSYTTWTSAIVYGTVTVTITSTVPCPITSETWVTTTTYDTVCQECEETTTSCGWGEVGCGGGGIQSTTTTDCPSGYVGCNGGGVQPVSTVTYTPTPGSTVVVVIMPSTAAQAETTVVNGQTGVVQVISNGAVKLGGKGRWSVGVAEVMGGVAAAVAVFVVVVL